MANESLKHAILKWIYGTPLPDGVQLFDSILSEAFRSVLKISCEEAEIFAQRNKKNHWNNFVKDLQSAEQNRLYPLARIIDEWESFTLVLVSSNSAKIYSISLGEIKDLKQLSKDIMNKHKKGGCSQARFNRLRRGAIHVFLRDVIGFHHLIR